MDRPWDDRRLHFVGIGGAGMSGLALVAYLSGVLALRRLLALPTPRVAHAAG